MISHARVVIVGGGVMGAALLYHLTKEGWTDIVLIEKTELTSGSTWHAAGQITHGLAQWGLGTIIKYGVEFYNGLEAETGQSVSWHGCGSMRVAYLDDEVDFIRHILSVGRGMGVPMEIIGPDEIRKLHPFFNLDGVQAALHTPDDGHVDLSGATMGMIKGARTAKATATTGSQISSSCPRASVHGTGRHRLPARGQRRRHLRQADRGVVRLRPADGEHHPPLLRDDPVDEFRELAHELPVVRDDMTYSGYIRMEQKSGLIGIYEKTDPARSGTTAPPGRRSTSFSRPITTGSCLIWRRPSNGCRCWRSTASSGRCTAPSPCRPTATCCWDRRRG